MVERNKEGQTEVSSTVFRKMVKKMALSKKKKKKRRSPRGAVETNLTRIHEDPGLIPGPAQQVKAPVLP